VIRLGFFTLDRFFGVVLPESLLAALVIFSTLGTLSVFFPGPVLTFFTCLLATIRPTVFLPTPARFTDRKTHMTSWTP